MASYILPKDFFFGAAMSGPQTEGRWKSDGKLENVWDRWSMLEPEAFYNLVGSYNGNNFMNHYQEDLKILHELGLSSLRTSIQWSRLLDANGKLNQSGADWYHRLFAAAKEQEIEVFVNLYHFDMPSFLFDRGGWESREVVYAYAAYARQAFAEFGQEIASWFTFNEPIVEPEQRYEMGVWYPKLHDAQKARTVQYNISLAHALAVEAFRAAQQQGLLKQNARIGLINCFSPSYTKDDPLQADLEAVRMNDGIRNRWWLDLVTKGSLPCDVIETLDENDINLPIQAGDREILRQGIVDWLGCNYYQPSRVQAPKQAKDAYGNPIFVEPYVWEQAHMNESRGWEMYPQGIYDLGMKFLHEYPDLQFFIAENGIGVKDEHTRRDEQGRIIDPYRIDFVRDHLIWLAKAIADGAHCCGYHYWGVIDNWSWCNAFKNRYGFVEVDLMEGYSRCLKQSAEWFKSVTTTHQIEVEDKGSVISD